MASGYPNASFGEAIAANAEADMRKKLTYLVAMDQIGTALGKELEKVLAEK